jgi:hypothetical protein
VIGGRPVSVLGLSLARNSMIPSLRPIARLSERPLRPAIAGFGLLLLLLLPELPLRDAPAG